jgi:hypothetical protein
MRNTYKILVAILDRKIIFERPKRRWEDNIKTDLKEIGCKGGICSTHGNEKYKNFSRNA